MFFRLLFIVAFLFLNLEFSYYQQPVPAKDPYYVNYPDTMQKILPAMEEEFTVNVRLLPDNQVQKYRNDPDFNYDGGLEEADDWITKIKNWINQQLATLRSSEAYWTTIDYIYYGLMIVAMFLIIRGLIKADRRGFLFGNIKTQEIKIVESEEDISNLNFDELIASAIDSKNYKLAVRYLFLKSLQQLSEKGMVELRNNKTNHQYISEIRDNQIASLFSNTTSRFEWIWYGDFPIDENVMKSSQNEFNEFFGLISS